MKLENIGRKLDSSLDKAEEGLKKGLDKSKNGIRKGINNLLATSEEKWKDHGKANALEAIKVSVENYLTQAAKYGESSAVKDVTDIVNASASASIVANAQAVAAQK